LRPLHVLRRLGVVPIQYNSVIEKLKVMEIKARQVLKIKTISTDKKYDVVEGHPFFGQTFNVYQYDGIAFTVNSNDDFVKWRNSGELFSVNFAESTRQKEVDGQMLDVPTLQLTGCTNIKQEVSMAKAEATLSRIYRDAEITAVDADFMSEFVND